MNKVKFLSLLSAVLFVTNLVLLGFMLFGKPPHPKHAGPRNIIIEKLGLDESQSQAYDTLIQAHRKAITTSEQEIMVLKKQLYSQLNTPSATAAKDSLIQVIGLAQVNIEHINYNHFEDIRKLCKENQLPKFELLTQEIAALFSPKPPKPQGK